jgi:hypothetical protein
MTLPTGYSTILIAWLTTTTLAFVGILRLPSCGLQFDKNLSIFRLALIALHGVTRRARRCDIRGPITAALNQWRTMFERDSFKSQFNLAIKAAPSPKVTLSEKLNLRAFALRLELMSLATMVRHAQPHLDLFRIIDPLLRTSRTIAGARGLNVLVVTALVYGLPLLGVCLAPLIVSSFNLLPVFFTPLTSVSVLLFPCFWVLSACALQFSRSLSDFRPLRTLLCFCRYALPTPSSDAEPADLSWTEARQRHFLQASRAAFPCRVRGLFNRRATLAPTVFVRTASGRIAPLSIACSPALLTARGKFTSGSIALPERGVRKNALASVAVFYASGILTIGHVACAPITRNMVRPIQVLTASVWAVFILPHREVRRSYS